MEGTTNNPNGRPRGSGNPLIKDIREKIRAGLNDNEVISRIFTKLNEIDDPYKYVQSAISVLELVLPRLVPVPGDPQPNGVGFFKELRENMYAQFVK